MNLNLRLILLLIALSNCTTKNNEFDNYQIIEEFEGRKRVKYFDKNGLRKVDYYLNNEILDMTVEKHVNQLSYKTTSFTIDGAKWIEINWFLDVKHGREVAFDDEGNIILENQYKFGVLQE